MPGGLIAKLHSRVASNSAACRSFMIERARSAVWAGVSVWFDTGTTLPSSLNAGGKPAVTNRSDAFLLTMTRSSSWTNLMA